MERVALAAKRVKSLANPSTLNIRPTAISSTAIPNSS